MFEDTFKQVCIIKCWFFSSQNTFSEAVNCNILRSRLSSVPVEIFYCLPAACGSWQKGKSGGNHVC